MGNIFLLKSLKKYLKFLVKYLWSIPSLNAALSLNVVCLISSKFLYNGSHDLKYFIGKICINILNKCLHDLKWVGNRQFTISKLALWDKIPKKVIENISFFCLKSQKAKINFYLFFRMEFIVKKCTKKLYR